MCFSPGSCPLPSSREFLTWDHPGESQQVEKFRKKVAADGLAVSPPAPKGLLGENLLDLLCLL